MGNIEGKHIGLRGDVLVEEAGEGRWKQEATLCLGFCPLICSSCETNAFLGEGTDVGNARMVGLYAR